MTEPHNHVPDVVAWVLQYWAVSGMIVGGIVGAAWYVLHKTFATHESQAMCKSDLIKALKDHENWEDAVHDGFKKENAEAHAEFRNDLRAIRQDIAAVKNILIDKMIEKK